MNHEEEMSLELRLAAIVTLLSSSALRGATPNKTHALRDHLSAAANMSFASQAPYLADALNQALAGWQAIECHPDSTPVNHCPLVTPGQLFH